MKNKRTYLIIAMVIAVFGLSLCLPSLVSAGAEVYIDTEETNTFEAETQISAHDYSRFTVVIPYDIPEDTESHVILKDVALEVGHRINIRIMNLDGDGMIPAYAQGPDGNLHRAQLEVKVNGCTPEQYQDIMASYDSTMFVNGVDNVWSSVEYHLDNAEVPGNYHGVISWRIVCVG